MSESARLDFDSNVTIFGCGSVGLAQLAPELMASGLHPNLVLYRSDETLEFQRQKQLVLGNYLVNMPGAKRVSCPQVHVARKPEEIVSACSQSTLWLSSIGYRHLPNLARFLSVAIDAISHRKQDVQLILLENAPLRSSHVAELRQQISVLVKKPESQQFIGSRLFVSEGVNYSSAWCMRDVPGEILEFGFCKKGPIWLDSSTITQLPALTRAIKAGIFAITSDFQLERDLKVLVHLHQYDGHNFLGAIHGCESLGDAIHHREVSRNVFDSVRNTLVALSLKHELPVEFLQNRMRDKLKFSDHELTDRIVRNCRDPMRKLAANERLVAPGILVMNHGGDTRPVSRIIASAVYLAECIRRRSNGYAFDENLGKLLNEGSLDQPPVNRTIDQVIEDIASKCPRLAGQVNSILDREKMNGLTNQGEHRFK